ncbi:HBR381Wp [Eremothecium sinecaudum]|uniref:HBR381Wp n=1 Tax=Eremothecium sinecaudum TaxID=45286 RepID=A0A109UY60_9SACH|nr:HBR381Wp [Eremothecium sinecaudum]AMD19282.1 HBR381Wp [Eremothecium sinecaudum]
MSIPHSEKGVVHGHIHNYNNLTYIHGHVHNNVKPKMEVDGENPDESVALINQSEKFNNDCAKFRDCQHFEFINYHNLNLLQEATRDSNMLLAANNASENIQDGGAESKKRKLNNCVQCQPKIMEVCCGQPHLESEVPKDVVLFEEVMNDNPQPKGEEDIDLPHFMNCEFTCQGSEHSTQTHETTPATTMKGDSDDQVFEKLCQQCMNYDPCEDPEGHHNQYAPECHKPIFNTETDMLILNDLVNISNMYDLPYTNPVDQSVNLLHSSISGLHDMTANIEHLPTENVPHQHHQHHHHHRIELHPHASCSSPKGDQNRGYTDDRLTSSLNTSEAVEITDHEANKNAPKQLKTNTIKFNWAFKNNGETFRCLWNGCTHSFQTLLDLQGHVFKEHIYNGNNVTQPENHCQWKDCTFLPENEDSLINHINGAHGIGFQIEFLDRNGTPQNFKHTCFSSATAIKAREDGTFQCIWDSCNQIFNSRKDLNDHIEVSHIPTGKSSYKCSWGTCSKTFTQRQKLLRHIKVHTGHKPYKCPDCNKHFSTEDILSQHMRTHSGEKPFQCQYCDKKFSSSSSLRIHIRTHTGEKPLVCKICGKRFNESSNLSKHMAVHERKYMCKCCKRSFDKLEQYNLHVAKCVYAKAKQQSFLACIR